MDLPELDDLQFCDGVARSETLTQAARQWGVPRIVCAAPKYLANRNPPRSIHELLEHDCIVIRENDSDYAVWRFGTESEETAVKVPGSMVSNDGDVATQWCVEGHGLLMRSRWHVAPMLRTGALVQLLGDLPTPSANIYAVHDSAQNLTRRAKLAIDHITEGLTGRLDIPAGQ
ncbi:LysR substrate-binding domain-containing protein [Saccharopolyspora elongata]|uniref:LysR substrate-binding domain-containing protein n=1 Tax=Saccharopolyspora elongata TaxID=2530387 RepID=A0A4R4YD15_9PSEU|nr:LysR substrate-binding domain-containing protein [Saccharopolyspora elongata]TDD42551.1 hypothetical protein E1288_29055 [Saccharopolyspora elongata]